MVVFVASGFYQTVKHWARIDQTIVTSVKTAGALIENQPSNLLYQVFPSQNMPTTEESGTPSASVMYSTRLELDLFFIY